MWNIASLCGKKGKVLDELTMWTIDVCCLQDMRWRGPVVGC